MGKVKIARTIRFEEIVDVLKTQTDKAVFQFSPEGLKVKGISSDYVTLVELNLNDCSYFCEVDEPVDIPLILEDVKIVLNKLDIFDIFTIEYDADLEKVTFTFQDDTIKKKLIKTVDFVREELPNLHIFPTSTTTLQLNTLRKILEEFRGYDILTISSDKDKIIFCVEDDVLTKEAILDNDCRDILVHSADIPTKAHYQLDYIYRFVKAVSRIYEEVTLKFSPNRILCLDVCRSGWKFWIGPLLIS